MSNTNVALQLRDQLHRMMPQLSEALPSHIKPEKFQRVVMTVVQNSPDLLAADRQSLLTACMKCAADGLVPDGREAALVIFSVKVNGNWIKKVQYMPMLSGILKRIRNSGEIASIQAHIIYAADKFVVRRGLNETIEHEPKFPGDRGPMIGAYAVAKFKDNSDPVFEIMDVTELDKVASVSRSRDKEGNPTGPWKEWREEMCRKTVLRRLSKYLPMDAEVEKVFRVDDRNGTPTDGSPVIDAEPDERERVTPPALTGKLDALEDMSRDDEIITEDGEVIAVSANPWLEKVLTAIPGMSRQELDRLDTSAEHKVAVKALSAEEYDRYQTVLNTRIAYVYASEKV